MNGRSATSSRHLGVARASGPSRVAKPPARTATGSRIMAIAAAATPALPAWEEPRPPVRVWEGSSPRPSPSALGTRPGQSLGFDFEGGDVQVLQAFARLLAGLRVEAQVMPGAADPP